MSDNLRRRALEGGKTTSNKSRSRQSSKPASKQNSKPGSRVASRDPSPDDGFLSDDTNQSINSVDALLESDDFNESTTETMKAQLESAIADITDRKWGASSYVHREDKMTTIVRLLTNHHLADALHHKTDELLDALIKSLRHGKTEFETTLALRAIGLVAVSIEEGGAYEVACGEIKKTIHGSEHTKVKASAIHALGICAYFGGAGDEEIVDTMTYLLEIVSSDGAFVDAADNAEVVTAACQAYGLLATQVEDLEDDSEDAVAAFLDQLDSTNAQVQIAAGENIALLFEKSYTPLEDDESLSDTEAANETSSSEEDSDLVKRYNGLVKRYNAYHNAREVIDKVSSLSSLSAKGVNRRDKQNIHRSFNSILMTVEDPRVGLRTNNASKMTIQIHKEYEIYVNRWWKLLRLNALRRVLATGFVNHYYEGNKQVIEALPVILADHGHKVMQSPNRHLNKSSKGKYRDQRRFVSAETQEDQGDV